MASRRLGPWLLVVAALVIGILAGREIASEQSRSFLGGIFIEVFLYVAIGVLIGAAVLRVSLRRGRGTPATKSLVAAAGLLAVGTFAGNLTADLTGAIDHPPAVLEAPGQAAIDLVAGVNPFAPRENSSVTCRSVPGQRIVGDLYAPDLGRLGTGMLRGTVSRSPGAIGEGSAELWITDIADGADQPFWSGPVTIQADPDGLTGVALFTGLLRENNAKGAATTSSTPTDGWPATMSGQLSWTCAAW